MTMRLVIRLGVLLSALMMTTACMGLGGEPQIVSTRLPAPTPTVTPITPPVVELGYPASTPDLTNGASIYAQHCASCHGDTGAGDGPVALNANLVVPSFLDPAVASPQTPHQWFSTITNGRLEKTMPPWKDALTEQERWDVALYTYTLHTTAEQVALGQSLYQECAECHGTTGLGDGPEAARLGLRAKNLTDQNAMVTLSDASIFEFVTEGFELDMPSFADRFSVDDRWAVVAYARSLSLTSSGAPAAQSDEALDITGAVTLFGAETLPAGLSVSLQAFDLGTGDLADLGVMMPAPVNADGTYTFEDILRNPDFAYFTVVNYQGYPFVSLPLQPDTAPALTLDAILYDVTTALTDVTATAWVHQITAYDGQLDVIIVVQVLNLSDTLMFSTGEFLPDGRPIAFTLPIPEGATLLPPDSAGQIISSDGRKMIDTQALPPRGQKLLTARYTMPYTLGEPLNLPTDLTVGGVVRVLIHPETMRVESDILPPLGEELIGGEFYKSYGDQLALLAGTGLDMVLNGQPLTADSAPTPSPTAQSSVAPTTGVAAATGVPSEILTPILALLGVGLVGATVFLVLRKPKP